MLSPNEQVRAVTLQSLRKKAEASVEPAVAADPAAMSELEVRKLLHELQVHQVELELQNEELRSAQIELAYSRDRIANLYDFAPVGYLTLNKHFLILDANHTLAHAIGLPRHKLLHQRLSRFIDACSHDELCLRLGALAGGQQVFETALRRADKSRLPVLLTLAPVEAGSTMQGAICRISVTDISERKKAEQKLKELNETLEERVADRSAKLVATNLELRNEIAQRERLEREIVEISEHERRYFGLELHDDICQQIVAIGMCSDMLAGRLKNQDRKTAKEIQRISKMLAEMLERTRELSRGLHPTGLDSEGLVPALKALANQASMRVECWVSYSKGELLIPKMVALQLYRIAQEAVSNALRHSKAKRIEIALHREEGSLVLSIADDGIGLDNNPSPHLGIRSMRHRAKLIGATLTMEANHPHGTSVACEMPHELLASPEAL